jgi:hypothetical protein
MVPDAAADLRRRLPGITGGIGGFGHDGDGIAGAVQKLRAGLTTPSPTIAHHPPNPGDRCGRRQQTQCLVGVTAELAGAPGANSGGAVAG